MLIPVIVLYAVVCVILLVLGIIKSSRNILAAMNLLFWLASAASAVAISWAWKDRGMGENWAIMGVVFFSFPIIVATIILAIATIIGITSVPTLLE
jgi:NADH:ubiquinone oxidoreductase subunit 2 (subunit N)